MRETDQGAGIDYNLVHEPGAEPRQVERLSKFGGDEHTMIADAMFLDPLSGDYRVQKGSPALEQGFKNFAMDRFGVRKPELKAIAKTPPLPGTLEAAQIASGGWGRQYRTPKTAHWLGAKLKEIENEGEMSAVGLGGKDGVLVVKVAAGGESQKVGLKENDVIRGVNDQCVRGLKDFATVWKDQVRRGGATLKVWRDQAELSIVVPAL